MKCQSVPVKLQGGTIQEAGVHINTYLFTVTVNTYVLCTGWSLRTEFSVFVLDVLPVVFRDLDVIFTVWCSLEENWLQFFFLVTQCVTVPDVLKYTGCNRRNGPDFERVFLMLNYTEKPQNTYIQSWTVWEIMASEVWNFDSCYTLTDYQIRIETGKNMWFL